ncbi:tRNA lysidine(34) synthetase TilS [Candidatus Pelagibacter sp.]|nr:tRNA lysidine(34) synthetase TilS [Candidatus Pelagibacter sp.]
MSPKNLSVKTKNLKHLKNLLKNKKVAQIYKKFERSIDIDENFAVAVSGGPDSLALAFLAKIYSIKKKIVSKFFIVDHKLRLESTKEASIVKRVLKDFMIDAEILTWKGKKPSKNIQAIARKKRYEILFKRCDKSKIKNILLGHHQDDLLENFFIRLLRGSGLKGLISLDKKNKVDNKILLRPLINQKKEDLVFLSKYIFNFFVEDPSNKDEKFKRIKVRALIEELKKNGLNKKKFIGTIKNLKRSNDVVNFYTRENIRKNSFFLYKKNKLILSEEFFNHPYEIVFRALSESIKMIGKKYYLVRGKKLDRILKDIKNNSLTKSTLGGCVLEKVNETLIITKEGIIN